MGWVPFYSFNYTDVKNMHIKQYIFCQTITQDDSNTLSRYLACLKRIDLVIFT